MYDDQQKWMPKHLTAPPQFLFWELEEFLPIVLGIGVFSMSQNFWYLGAGFGVSQVIGFYKKTAPQGFLHHSFYSLGLCEMDGLPSGVSRIFVE